jgi:hypothetical protein
MSRTGESLTPWAADANSSSAVLQQLNQYCNPVFLFQSVFLVSTVKRHCSRFFFLTFSSSAILVSSIEIRVSFRVSDV